MLTVLMTSVTKGAHSVNEIVDKVRTLYSINARFSMDDQVMSALQSMTMRMALPEQPRARSSVQVGIAYDKSRRRGLM